jgi:hypothetical protein
MKWRGKERRTHFVLASAHSVCVGLLSISGKRATGIEPANLIVLPIIAVYRTYYGTPFALRIVALTYVTMALAALVIDVVFGAIGLIPSERPGTEDVFGSIQLDYKAALNAAGLVIFIWMFAVSARKPTAEPA